MTAVARRPRRLPAGVDAVRLLARPAGQGRGRPSRSAAATSARRTSGAPTGRRTGSRSCCSTSRRASCRRSSARCSSASSTGVLAGGAAMLGHWRPLFLGFQKGGKTVATAGGALLGVAPLLGLIGLGDLDRRVPGLPVRVARSIVAALALPLVGLALGEPWPVIAFAAIAAVGGGRPPPRRTSRGSGREPRAASARRRGATVCSAVRRIERGRAAAKRTPSGILRVPDPRERIRDLR